MKNLPTSGCPICFHKLDSAASSLPDVRPEPGDISVCIYCASLLEFDDTLNPIPMTDATRSQLEPEIWAKVEKIQSIIKEVNSR